jgi:hypothetical protein
VIVTIPPRLLANLRALQAAQNQTLQGFLLSLDLPEGAQGQLDLDHGVINFPDLPPAKLND